MNPPTKPKEETKMRLYFNLCCGAWVWRLKQLLPLTYRSRYRDARDRCHFAVWRMWFGRCFGVDDVVITQD